MIAKVDGGIGNQFFIYAAAYELAKQLDAEIWLYLNEPVKSKASLYVIRDYALDNYSIKYD